MTLRSFKHLNAESVDEAIAIAAELGTKATFIAGGSDLLGALKDDIYPTYPEFIVNIKTLPNLRYVTENEKGLSIGALTTLHELETSEIVRRKYRILAEAARSVASPQIRNVATIGGNICQHPRCWYLRNQGNLFYCLRKGGKKCNALTGENRYHSIFGAARAGSPPCSSECPGHVDIQSYLRKINDGELNEAARILVECNPIPAITGRVCPHFCEVACNRSEFDESVSVRGIERFMGDYILDNANEILKPQSDSGKAVAVVGSGPAGLSAAYYLRMAGHRVTVLERMKELGGMLTNCIPKYRLPREIVHRQIEALRNLGIEFRENTNVGVDVTFENLRKDFDALFLATGAWRQRTLGIEGEELTLSGVEFLKKVALGSREPPGKRVLVIGGGNVAVDAAITALRLGAHEVTMACLECRAEMPAIPEDVEEAMSGGVKVMPSWGPRRILKEHGRISGMELVQCTSVFNERGEFHPTFASDVKKTIEADQIILAIGQTADLSYLRQSLTTERGLIAVNRDSQETNMPGVFAGGDITTGTASVVEAIAAARKAASSITFYLAGETGPTEGRPPDVQHLLKVDAASLEKTPRVKMPESPRSGRSVDLEDIRGFYRSAMETEAKRCFNCGCVAVNASDMAPVLIALEAKIITTRRTIDAQDFFGAGPMKSTVIDADELVTRIEIPDSRAWDKQIHIKFRTRNSIDFPVASVASVFRMNGDKIDDVRIVVGAAAPIPYRVKEVEAFLRGKTFNEEIAERAATVAVQESDPLGRNTYKVQIVKALMTKSILAARDT